MLMLFPYAKRKKGQTFWRGTVFLVARVFVLIVSFSVFQRLAKDEAKCDSKEILWKKEKGLH